MQEHEAIGMVTNPPIDLGIGDIELSGFSLDTNGTVLVSYFCDVDSVFILLWDIPYIQRGRYEVPPVIGDDNTLTTMPCEDCSTDNRETLVRNIIHILPERRDDVSVTCIPHGAKEGELVTGITDASRVHRDEGRGVGVPPVDDDIVPTGPEPGRLALENEAA